MNTEHNKMEDPETEWQQDSYNLSGLEDNYETNYRLDSDDDDEDKDEEDEAEEEQEESHKDWGETDPTDSPNQPSSGMDPTGPGSAV